MESFVEKTLKLIAEERDAETLESLESVKQQLDGGESNLESQGICFSKLHVRTIVIARKFYSGSIMNNNYNNHDYLI